jgi:hypothetical protein
MVTGDEQLTKIIGLHLSLSDSENPFQDVGIEGIVFDINDTRAQPLIRHRLRTLFDRLKAEGRASLDEQSVRFVSTPGSGELELLFRYWNLRTNEPGDFRGTLDLMSGRMIPS